MIARFSNNKFGPIGIDIGSQSVKLVQFTADGENGSGIGYRIRQ